MRGPPARSADRAAGGVGAAERDLLARAHVPRPGRRAGDDDPRHRARPPTRTPASGPTTSTWRCATTPSPTRSSSTTSCSGSAPRARARGWSTTAPPRSADRSRSTPTAGSSPAATPAGRPGWRWSTRSSSSCGARPATARSTGARTALAHLVGGGSVCTVSLFEGCERGHAEYGPPRWSHERRADDRRRWRTSCWSRGREVQGAAVAADAVGPTGQFPAARLAPDFYRYVAETRLRDDLVAARAAPSATAAWSPSPSSPPSAAPRSCGPTSPAPLNVGISTRRSSSRC